MKLLLKFNAIVLLTLGIGLAVAWFASRRWLEEDAQREVDMQARMLMQAASSVRHYTTENIQKVVPPQTKTQAGDVFHKEFVPAFAAKTVLGDMQKKDPSLRNYLYKEASKNPTNPEDLAEASEITLIELFQADPGKPERRGVEPVGDESFYFLARPLVLTDQSCLGCHGTPEEAAAKFPAMFDKYDRCHGFQWQMNQVVAVQIVRVPMEKIIAKRDEALRGLAGSMASVVGLTFLLLNLGLVVFVTRPVARLSRMANEISVGHMEVREIPVRGNDEISMLTAAFNRMSRSIVKAFKLLKGS
jgi:HAMP domain-containing protein